MKENDYFPPKCNVLYIEHVQCICASSNKDTSSSTEDFEIDLVEF